MSSKKTTLKIYLMRNQSVNVRVPKRMWKEVSEWCKNHSGYLIQEEYRGQKVYSIWAKTPNCFTDLIKKISDIIWG